ncbi:MAG: RNA polymerase sigma factor [Alphaproteobacteria bacterium]|nr:MAG: RNA polymerase sigma factor [Alphaproteobacteria bacterium]
MGMASSRWPEDEVPQRLKAALNVLKPDFNAIAQGLWPHIIRIARVVKKHAGTNGQIGADDLAQECWVRFQCKAKELDTSGILSWFYAVARHLISKQRKQHTRNKKYTEKTFKHRRFLGKSDTKGGSPLADKTLAYIESLSPEEQDALLLIHGYNYSYKQAAAALDVTVSTVNNWANRGKNKVRGKIEGDPKQVRFHPITRDAR